MKKVEFTSKQIIGEYWISFISEKDIQSKSKEGDKKQLIEVGIIVKKLSDGRYLIPSGITKKIFVFEEIEKLVVDENNVVYLPFVIGITDFHSTSAMKPETFNSFLKAFKEAFCLPEAPPPK